MIEGDRIRIYKLIKDSLIIHQTFILIRLCDIHIYLIHVKTKIHHTGLGNYIYNGYC